MRVKLVAFFLSISLCASAQWVWITDTYNGWSQRSHIYVKPIGDLDDSVYLRINAFFYTKVPKTILTPVDISGKLNTNGNGSALTGLTKSQVGLSNVDNTSDAAKPASDAVVTALGLKQNTITNGSITNAQLVNGAVANLSGTNTGDNATNTQYSGLVSNANHTGDATGSTALTLATVNSNVGSFTAANITVNAKGLITAAANGAVATVSRLFLPNDVINNNASANTIADVTALSFAVNANVTYRFKFYIVYSAAATTTGSRWSINGPATTFMHYNSEYTLTATSKTTNAGVAAYNTPSGVSASSLATGNICIIEGTIRPSAGGTVIARFSSEISSSAITAIASGRSYVEWEVIN